MVRLLGYARAFKLGILGETIPAQQALEMGFLEVVSGPLVRSSYRADRVFDGNNVGLG